MEGFYVNTCFISSGHHLGLLAALQFRALHIHHAAAVDYAWALCTGWSFRLIADAVLEQPGDSASQPEQQPELGAALASEATSQQDV